MENEKKQKTEDIALDNTEALQPEGVETNPQKPGKKKNIVWIFDVLGTLVALVAAVISLVTLFEMKIQRNNAYMPTIVFESVEVKTDLTNSEQEGIYNGIKLSTRNIGVGVAKKITFELDSSNYIRWLKLYNDLNPENPYHYEMNHGVVTISMGGKVVNFAADYKSEKLFLLPNAEESYEFMLPAHYKILLHEIYKNANTGLIDIPDLEIKVAYSDVQNVMYEETVRLSVNTMLFTIGSEGEKSVTYQIIMD